MTIEQSLNDKVLSLNMDNLNATELEWLHWVNTLFTWAWISKTRRELHERAKG